ncbi:MAG: phosphate ABC transporter permease PstA [Caldilineaceae bacterium]|nr:phosphate ABC transporter permease PstA [Caldilineaceae bacterium]
MAKQSVAASAAFPEGETLKKQVATRLGRATLWSNLFMLATMVGVLALLALLYNILNSAFGYVALQNKIDPSALVMQVEEERLLAAPNLVSSADDDALASGIAADPHAIGFFGYAYYQAHADELRLLPVEEVSPSAATVESGEYPLARPLYLYTTVQALAAKPQLAEFLHFYLTNVNNEIDDVGYFPASADVLAASLAKLAASAGTAGEPNADPILTTGSSTVYPLTVRLSEQFANAGFAGEIATESTGTSAGFVQLCQRNSTVDLVNASRAINRAEIDACGKAKVTPIELRVGTDALAIVVSRANDFLNTVTFEQLRQLFTTAATWSDVSPGWPNAPIARFTPDVTSGTLDFFVEETFDRELADLPKETLMDILAANVSAGLMRRLENDMPFVERSQEDVYNLVEERVVEPKIVRTWSLRDSLLMRSEIEAQVTEIPNGQLIFRNWVTTDLLTAAQSSDPLHAGVRTALLGSLWVILITILFSLPVGVGAAIYLEEYAGKNWFNRLVETNINNLAGVPSIIYGMLGLAIFVRILEPFTSGTMFGLSDPTTSNGRTVLSAGLTLGLLILPVIIINAREAIRAVPSSLRQASFGLGATQWQTIWHHVLPSSLSGILTGTILAISRAIGETAPLVVIGASTFIVVDPNGPFAKFTTLPIQIYQWTSRPQAEFRNLAAAAIVVLLILLLTLNASAVLLRNRYSSRRV